MVAKTCVFYGNTKLDWLGQMIPKIYSSYFGHIND